MSTAIHREIPSEEIDERASPAAAAALRDQGAPALGLVVNPRYTFDAFVTGTSNRFAHAAALSVAETPARSYNPLFIYGDAGLGKTHLLQAIANYVGENYPTYQVRYVSTEQFLNQYVDAIRQATLGEFKKRYREIDVLLLDDIQFIEGKEGLQEELFHTFESLYQANRQIVLSSDRPPDAISTLEDRLRSRFKMGLTTEINPPELETRLAILRKKSEREPIAPSPEVLEFIATNITNNIRELEGALIRVCAYASLTGEPLSVDLAEGVLGDILSDTQPRPITPELILDKTAEMFAFPIEDIRGQEPSSSPRHRPPDRHVRHAGDDRSQLSGHRPGVRRARPHHRDPRGREDRRAHEGAPSDLRPGHRAHPADPERLMAFSHEQARGGQARGRRRAAPWTRGGQGACHPPASRDPVRTCGQLWISVGRRNRPHAGTMPFCPQSTAPITATTRTSFFLK